MAYMEILPPLHPAQCSLVQQRLQAWLQGPGEGLLCQQRELLRRHMTAMPGECVAQLGLVGTNWLPDHYNPRRVLMDIGEDAASPNLPHRLALGSDSVDTALMPYVLESLVQPELMLREARRVLVPGGSMLIFMMARFRGMPQLLSSRALPLRRLRRALAWVECDVVACRKVLVAGAAWSPRALFPGAFGEAWGWFVHAQKGAAAVTPLPIAAGARRGQGRPDPVLSAGRASCGK